jgi:hypothetical protein
MEFCGQNPSKRVALVKMNDLPQNSQAQRVALSQRQALSKQRKLELWACLIPRLGQGGSFCFVRFINRKKSHQKKGNNNNAKNDK